MPSVHLLSSQHVTHPFNFPRLYPLDEFEWLEAVNESHIHVDVELREADGRIVQEAVCARRMFPHGSR